MRLRVAATAGAIGLSVALLAACTASAPAASPTASRTPVASSVASAPASPAPPAGPSVATLTSEAKRVKLKASTVRGFKLIHTDNPGGLLGMCSGDLDSDIAIVYSRSSLWANFAVPFLEYDVYAYQADTGAAVVAQARAFGKSCKKYTDGDSKNMDRDTVDSSYTLRAPAGIDAIYTFIDTQTTLTPARLKGQVFVYYTAVMSRGHLVVQVTAGASSSTTARAQLTRLLQPAATALVAAVPKSQT